MLCGCYRESGFLLRLGRVRIAGFAGLLSVKGCCQQSASSDRTVLCSSPKLATGWQGRCHRDMESAFPGDVVPSRQRHHRHRRPACRSRRQRALSRRDLLVGLSERPECADRRRAPPAPLVPHQAHRAPERASGSTYPAGLLPLDHTAPPQPPHAGRDRVRMCNANGLPAHHRRRGSSRRPDRPATRRYASGSPRPGASSDPVSVNLDPGGPHHTHRGPSARSFSKSRIPRLTPRQHRYEVSAA